MVQKISFNSNSFPSYEGRFGAQYPLRMDPFSEHGFWHNLLSARSRRLLGVERADGTRLLVSLGTWIRVDYFVNPIDQSVNLADFHGFQPIEQGNKPVSIGIFVHMKVWMVIILMCLL